ncbi:MAG: GNAT family N-acetyltransferase, partial [Pseudomonadota bacterium]
KMGVTTAARGQKAGEALLHALIARAEELDAKDLFLMTNSICAPAIHLYEKAGFVHSTDVKENFGKTYGRCDVAMRFGGATLSPAAKALP